MSWDKVFKVSSGEGHRLIVLQVVLNCKC